MTEKKHRNTASLTPEDFLASARNLLGEDSKVWRKRFMNLTGFNASTVTRLVSGAIPVTELVASLLFSLEMLKYHKVDYIEEFGLDG